MSRDKDRILEQALTHELRSNAGMQTADCLDAETIAAWEDGGLDAAQMAIAELHLSTCARCQAMVGVMAQADSAVGTPAPGTPALSTPAPSTLAWWRWWLAPIAAATAAVTLWMVIPEQQQMATAPATRDAVVQPSATVDSTAPAEPKTLAKDRAEEPPATLAARDDRRARQAAAPAEAKKEETGKLMAEQRGASPPSADAAAPAAMAASPAAPAPQADAGAPGANAALQKSARAVVPPNEIASPNSTRRWRIIQGGVELSSDQGASWNQVRAASGESLTGGVSPSGTICWLIGRDGVVLVTADGAIFAKVDLPVKVDIVSIAATDARSATVTTADGRTFRTDDSGRNWRQN